MKEPVRYSTRIGDPKMPYLLPITFEWALAKVGIIQVQVTWAARPRNQPFRTARIPSGSGLFSNRVILVREPNEGGQIAF